MIVYVDSSALLKRVLLEDHHRALRARVAELEAGPHEMITSTLSWVEVTRALKARSQRTGDSFEDFDARALAGISVMPVSYEVVAQARRIGPQSLRSLDAVHCATASVIDASLLLSYDERMLDAARMIGFATESPGVAE